MSHFLLRGFSALAVWLLLADSSFAVRYFEGDSECFYDLSDSPANAPRFEDYPVRVVPIKKPHAVDFKGNREAWRFRTVLRDGAPDGPNFAGHYTFVHHGCGSSCDAVFIVDALTGHAERPKTYEAVSTVYTNDIDKSGHQYRIDSSLIAVVGAPNEDDDREGISYLNWDGRGLKLLRFVSKADICKAHPNPNKK